MQSKSKILGLFAGTALAAICAPTAALANIPPDSTLTRNNPDIVVTQGKYSPAGPVVTVQIYAVVNAGQAFPPFSEEYLEISASNTSAALIDVGQYCNRTGAQNRALECQIPFELSPADANSANTSIQARLLLRKTTPSWQGYIVGGAIATKQSGHGGPSGSGANSGGTTTGSTPPPPGPDVNFLSGRGTSWSVRWAEGYTDPGSYDPSPGWVLMGSEGASDPYDGEVAASEQRYVLCVKPGSAMSVPASYNARYNQSNWRPRFYYGWSGVEYAVSAGKLLVQNATKSAMHAECQQLGTGFTVANFHQARDRTVNRGGWNAGGLVSATGPNQHLLREPANWLRNSSPSDASQFLIYIKDQN